MANAIHIPKTHLIMGLSLPLAVLLGYFVAEPMELGSLAVVVLVLVVLCVPLLMKWYYPLLVLSWNAAISPAFLPGRPGLWTMIAGIGLLLAVLSRAVNPNVRFVIEPSIIKPLLALTGVVVATGMITGGFGIMALGAGNIGGKNYFLFLAAVAGYFIFTSRRIPPQRVGLYVAIFFLSTLTYGLADVAVLLSPHLDFLLWFLTPSHAMIKASSPAPLSFPEVYVRLHGLSVLGAGVYCYLLARFGVRGLMDLTKPYRIFLLCLALFAGLSSGFRSFVVLGALTFTILFYLEGLHRTRHMVALLCVILLGSLVLLPQAENFPVMAQRALSFLPGKFSHVARADAESTLEWRVQMWKEALPEVPKRLFRGRGWAFNAREFEMADASTPFSTELLVGNFHNGPLSVLIPFGLYGAVAFVWFLVAGLRVLHRNWKLGNPALRRVNALLLSAFAAQTLFFCFCFGSLHSDIAIFAGLLGLGVALNGAHTSPARAEQATAGVDFHTEYIRAWRATGSAD